MSEDDFDFVNPPPKRTKTHELYDPEFVKSLLDAAKAPPEATFNNSEEALAWLNDHKISFSPEKSR